MWVLVSCGAFTDRRPGKEGVLEERVPQVDVSCCTNTLDKEGRDVCSGDTAIKEGKTQNMFKINIQEKKALPFVIATARPWAWLVQPFICVKCWEMQEQTWRCDEEGIRNGIMLGRTP